MKRNHFFMSGTLALVGALMLSGCNNTVDGVDDGNNTSNGETVKTQFSISIPYNGNGSSTRMSEGNTQALSKFLGMQDIKLIPFISSSSIDGESTMNNRGAVLSLASIGSAGLDKNTNSAKVYDNVQLEVGTNKFLFYGQAPTTGSSFSQGGLTNTISALTPEAGKVDNIKFSLNSVTEQNLAEYEVANDYETYLNNILTPNWKTVYGISDPTGSTKELKDLYTSFVKLQAGSAVAIAKAVADLYDALDRFVGSTEKATGDITVGAIAGEIRDIITTGIAGKFSFSTTAITTPYNLTPNYNTEDGPYETFPTELKVPQGAVQVAYSTTDNTFSYVLGNYNSTNLGTSITALSSYVYPPALWYFANSDIKCSNSSQLANYGQNATDGGWDILLGFYTNGSAVSLTTRSIAMVNRIKYGVGRLESRVVFGAETVEDNNTINPTVTIPTEGFNITGILVGGQKNVDWKFQPIAESAQYTIYDQAVAEGFVAKKQGETATKNHTLVLETAEGVNEVYVAIELVNALDKSIYGINGAIIPSGSKFYLVGKLDKTDSKTTASNDGATSIFQQAYVTIADFTIGSLKNAYNVLPDLRATELELGLSVDLSWKTGYSFNVTID